MGPTTITLTCLPVVSYAMAHNRIPVVDELVVTADRDAEGAVLELAVVDAEGVLSATCTHVVDLAAGDRTVVADVRLTLDPGQMLQVEEQRPGRGSPRPCGSARRCWRPRRPTSGCSPRGSGSPSRPSCRWRCSPRSSCRTTRPSARCSTRRPRCCAERTGRRRCRATRPGPSASTQSCGPCSTPPRPRDPLRGAAGELGRRRAAGAHARRRCWTSGWAPASTRRSRWRPCSSSAASGRWSGWCRGTPSSATGARRPRWPTSSSPTPPPWSTSSTSARSGWSRRRCSPSTDAAHDVDAAHRSAYSRWLAGDLDEVLGVDRRVDGAAQRRAPAAGPRAHAVRRRAGRQLPGGRRTAPRRAPPTTTSRASGRPARRCRPAWQRWKNALLDLSLRNRLINFADRSAASLARPAGPARATSRTWSSAGRGRCTCTRRTWSTRCTSRAASRTPRTCRRTCSPRPSTSARRCGPTSRRRRTPPGCARSPTGRARSSGGDRRQQPLPRPRLAGVGLDGRPLRSPVVLVPVHLVDAGTAARLPDRARRDGHEHAELLPAGEAAPGARRRRARTR